MKKLKELIFTLTEARATRLMDISNAVAKLPFVQKLISINYLSNGITFLVRTDDGNAYEFVVRPAKYAELS